VVWGEEQRDSPYPDCFESRQHDHYPVPPISKDALVVDLQSFLRYALDYVDAIPDDVAERLPAMPGFDRDHAELLLQTAAQTAATPQSSDLDPATRPIPNGGHVLVWARPKNRNWTAYDGTNNLGLHNDEFRPCLLQGNGHGRGLVSHGEATHHRLSEFEAAEDVTR
jgi:hypothetical protein